MRRNIYLTVITVVTVVCIVVGSLRYVGGFGGGLFSEDDTVPGTLFDDEADMGTISSVRVEAEVMDIRIQAGDAFVVSYRGDEDLKPVVEEEGGVLVISQKGKAKKRWSGIRKNGCDLTVTVPGDQELSLLECTMNFGDLDVTGVRCADTGLNANVGDISVSSAETGNARIHLDTGDIDVQNCTFGALDISLNVGDVEIKTSAALGDCGLDLKTDIGDVELNDKESGKAITQSGKADAPKIKVRNNVGDIEVSQS